MFKARRISTFLLQQRKSNGDNYLSSTLLSPSLKTPSYQQVYRQKQPIATPKHVINNIGSPVIPQVKGNTSSQSALNSNNSAKDIRKKIPIYHYIRPVIHGTVGSFIIFAVTGMLSFHNKLKQAQQLRKIAKEEKDADNASSSSSSTDEYSTINSSSATRNSSCSEQPSLSSKLPKTDSVSVNNASTSATAASAAANKTDVDNKNNISATISTPIFSSKSGGDLVLIGMNAAVLLCWRFKRMQRFMTTWFQHNVTPRTKPLTLLSASFSHQKLLVHYVPNMTALVLFFGPVEYATSQYEAAAIYLSAGVMGFSVSHVARLAWYQHFGQKLVPSLGASGSVMGLVGVVICCYNGQDQKELMHVDKELLITSLIIDVLGLLKRSTIVDHAAHLGGAAVGIFYAHFGRELIWDPMFDKLIQLRRAIVIALL